MPRQTINELVQHTMGLYFTDARDAFARVQLERALILGIAAGLGRSIEIREESRLPLKLRPEGLEIPPAAPAEDTPLGFGSLARPGGDALLEPALEVSSA